MMHNKLIIHIGIPKTGTTALQSFLHNNKENLLKHGYVFPDFKALLPDYNCHVAYTYEKNGDIFFSKDMNIDPTSDNWKNAVCIIRKELKKNNVIISNEEFTHSFNIRFFQEIYKEFPQVLFVTYLRRQDREIEAWWNTLVKFGEKRLFHEYVEQMENSLSWLNYKKLIDSIINVTDRSNLSVRIYDRKKLVSNCIEADFLEICGIQDDISKWNKAKCSNSRVGDSYIEIKRIMNEVIPYSCTADWGKYIMNLSERDVKEGDGVYFSKEERKSFLEKYHVSNKLVAKEWFNTDELFDYDENENHGETNHIYIDSFTKDIIRTFGYLLSITEQKIDNYVRLSETRYKSIIACLSNKRKICVFGAGNYGRKILKNMDIDIVVDNDSQKCGKQICGHVVRHIDIIENWSEYYVIIAAEDTLSMENQLCSYGLKKINDYILAKELLFEIIYFS